MSASQKYLFIFLGITMWLGLEYASLNHYINSPSLIRTILKNKHLLVTTEPGKPLSYFLGWLGFLTMCVTNLYVLRKRLPMMQNMGNLSGWLDFHIFCGMLGPILIIFHTDFKVGGLVAISFWSMIISASSGVIGRYFYFQLLDSAHSLQTHIAKYDAAFSTIVKKSGKKLSEGMMQKIKVKVLALAGVHLREDHEHPPGLLSALGRSLVGDIRLRFSYDSRLQALPSSLRQRLKEYAVLHRRAEFSTQFKQLMGYWHTFHLPFAYFMYGVAIIHIIVVLLFRAPT